MKIYAQDDLPAHKGVKGMCKNSTRVLSWNSIDNGLNLFPIPQSNAFFKGHENGLQLTIRVDQITKPEDYQIFDAFRQENISLILDLIYDRKGINAVDEWGQTPVSI